MEKFEIDLKWASYFVIVNVIVLNTVTLLSIVFFLLNGYNPKFIFVILIILFVTQLLYFARKAIKENKKHQTVRIIGKLFIFIRVFILSFLFQYFLIYGTDELYFQTRKKDLSEFLMEDNDDELNNKSNWLNDLVIMINRRFAK